MDKLPVDLEQENSKQSMYQGIMVRKSNEFVSGKYKSTLLENKLMAFALTRLRIVNNTPVADMYRSDIVSVLGCKDRNIYRRLKAAATNMSGHVICLEDKKGNFQCFSMVNNASYIDGVFTIKFNQEMMPYVTNLKYNFTTYELAALARFDYNHSYRIYELLKKEIYKADPNINNGIVQKSYGLNELRCELGLINMDDKEVKKAINERKSWDEIYETVARDRQFPSWYDFKRHVLDVAQEELKEKSDICFEYQADGKGQGSKVRNITFFIKSNELNPVDKIEISQKESIIVQRNADYAEKAKAMDEHPLPDMLLEYIDHNHISMEDMKIFYEDADYDATKVLDAIELADRQECINNYVGWIRRCITDGYKEPVQVLSGSVEKAEQVQAIHNIISSDAENVAARAWKRITTKDDYADFISYCEANGLSEKSLNLIYENSEKIDQYTDWKLHHKI